MDTPLHESLTPLSALIAPAPERNPDLPGAVQPERLAGGLTLPDPLRWIDDLSDAIIIADPTWHIQHWNRAAEQIYGWPRATAVGRTTTELMAVVSYAQGESTLSAQNTLSSTGAWQGEVVQRACDGRELIIDATVRAQFTDDGALRGYTLINRDITAHAQATAAPGDSQADVRTLAESLPQLVWTCSADGVCDYLSPQWVAYTGTATAALLGLGWLDYLHPDDRPGVQTAWRRTVAAAAIWDVTFRLRRADGAYRWFATRAVPHYSAAGTLVKWLGTCTDIDDQKQIEAALRQSEARFAAAFYTSPIAFAITEAATGRYIEVNASLLRLIGYTADELIGQTSLTLDTFVDPHERAALQAELATRGVVRDHAMQARTKAGDIRHVLVSLTAFELAGADCLFTVVVDVTERVHMEQALWRAADRLTTLHEIDRAILETHAPATIANAMLVRVRALMGCPHASVVLYDQQGAITQVFTTDDLFAATMRVGTPLAARGRPLLARFQRGEPWRDNDLDPQTYDAPLAELMAAKQVRSLLCVPLLVQWQLVGSLNLAAPAPGAFSDEHVTIAQELGATLAIALHNAGLIESLQLELAARARAEVALVAEHQRVVQLKNEFLATMSHELRTPLNAVLGHGQLLGEEIYGPLTERQQRAVQSINVSGHNLLSLINDILDYTKLDAGRMALTIGVTAVPSLCRDSVRAIAAQAQAKQILVSTTLDSAVTLIQADGRRLQQMLGNLLANAVKFTPAGGEVGLEVRGDAARQQVIFTVWDTGIGIAEADLRKLFQPFTQLDGRLSREYEGTGLGLALVRRLAEAHDGSVTVESVFGQGSRFSVTLPWETPRAPDEPPPAAAQPVPIPIPQIIPSLTPAPSSARPTILLVEERESNVVMMREILEAHGYQMLAAYTGSEGLALAREARPALILMDIHLPGMSGLEAIERMRADARLRTIPIVAITALAMPGDRERCIEAGADDYLAKPVNLHELLRAIDMQLRLQTEAAPAPPADKLAVRPV